MSSDGTGKAESEQRLDGNPSRDTESESMRISERDTRRTRKPSVSISESVWALGFRER